MQIDPSINLAIALVVLVLLGVLISRWGRLNLEGQIAIASVRALVQLALVSGIVVLAVQQLWSGALFVLAMFAIAVWTTTGRVGTRKAWAWTSLAMAAGVIPVLAVIFLTGAAPFNGYSLIPIGSIIVGNVMTANTLTGRNIYTALRNGIPTYEGALALGFERPQAMQLIMQAVRQEATIPSLDSTRTVGLVTLPGAFVGVLLGGGTALQAGASQLLVLVGILVGNICTAVAAQALISRAKLLPEDLQQKLHP